MNSASFNLSLILFFIFAAIILLAAIWYMVRGIKNNNAPEGDKNAVYRDQLEELKQALSLGQIDEKEYENARMEIGRRLARNKNAESKISAPINPKIAFIIAGIFGAATIVTYFFIGSPTMGDKPIAAREKELLARNPETLSTEEIKLILEQKSRENPKDATPHLLMGKILAGEGRDDEAMRAFQAALRRNPNDAETLAEIGGVIFRLSGNVESADSDGALVAALKIDPANMTARFYQGLIKWDAGQKEQALNIWRAGWEKYPQNDPKRLAIIARIVPEISKLDKGPNSADGGEAPFMAAMQSGQDPKEFIKTMVSNRLVSLAQDPNDIGLRLSSMRVLLMSGDVNHAQKVYNDGLARYKSDRFKSEILEVAAMMAQNAPQNTRQGETTKGANSGDSSPQK